MHVLFVILVLVEIGMACAGMTLRVMRRAIS